MAKPAKVPHLFARVSRETFNKFEKKSVALGYNRSEVMRVLVQSFVDDKITLPKRATPEVSTQ